MADIVDTAINAGSFGTLVTALNTAGLVEALKAPGPFTVFAPTDEAFSKLPSGAVEALLEDVIKLRKVLEYHVISGQVLAADVVKLSSAETVAGLPVQITVSEGVVHVNEAQVITPDVVADNGVIHVVDTVLIPAE